MAQARKKKSAIQQKLDLADQIIADQTEVIDQQLDRINRMLEPYEKLKEKANRLQAARRALLGGSRQTGEGGTRLRQEDIVAYLRENPGSSAGDIAKHQGVNQNTVSSALYRGKNERYLTKDKRWWLRDPKSGINTVEDIEEE